MIRSVVTRLVRVALPVVITAAVGLGLGWLSRHFFVVGVVPIVCGLTAGAVASVISLSGAPARWPGRAVAALAIVAGFGMFVTFEDHHFVQSFRDDLTRTRMADSGAPPGAFSDGDAAAFLAPDAADLLERQVRDAVGVGGFAGRWLFRADNGIRLAGSWTSSRGLAVGRIGAIAWVLLELAGAFLIASMVLARTRRSAAEEQQLDQQGGKEDGGAADADEARLP